MSEVRSRPTLDRRAALRRLGLGAVGLALGSCVPGRSVRARGSWLAEPDARRFARVRVSWDRVVRTVVGLRPFRPSGFVVRAQRFDETLVIHDYGHGGGGVTLSWGTAELALREALRSEERRVAVLGCGAVGLATARLLQQAGRDVTVYARELPPRTTSNVAGAQFSPYSVFEDGETTPAFDRRFREATRIAHRRFQDFLGSRYGVRFVENWYVSDRPVRLPGWMMELRDVFPDVTEHPPRSHPFPRRYATSVTTLFVEPGRYLRSLLEDVRRAGAEIRIRDLGGLGEVLSLPEKVVMNCTGLGARELFDDEELVPVKGQLTVLRPQPEVDYLLLDGGLYMFPRSDGILLGGTFQRHEEALEPDREAMRRVVEGHKALFAADPSTAGARSGATG